MELNGWWLFWLCGKVLGGSSFINVMIYICGYCVDYDGWVVVGNWGWSYDEVLLYFKCSEDFEDGFDVFYGVGGLLYVEYCCYIYFICDVLIDGFVEFGYLCNDDFNVV